MIMLSDQLIDISNLRKDEYIHKHINNILPRLLIIKSLDTFIDKLSTARFIHMKQLANNNLSLYKTNEIDIGYTNKLTIEELHTLISTNKVNKDIPIYLKYQHGNVFSYILLKDIDQKLLLREDIYIITHEVTKELYLLSIGKFGNPNRLYYNSDLNDIVTTFDKVKTLDGIQRFDIRS